MKTTICTDYTGRVIVQPLKLQRLIGISATDASGTNTFLELTPDQCGVLIFAIETELARLGVQPCN